MNGSTQKRKSPDTGWTHQLYFKVILILGITFVLWEYLATFDSFGILRFTPSALNRKTLESFHIKNLFPSHNMLDKNFFTVLRIWGLLNFSLLFLWFLTMKELFKYFTVNFITENFNSNFNTFYFNFNLRSIF